MSRSIIALIEGWYVGHLHVQYFIVMYNYTVLGVASHGYLCLSVSLQSKPRILIETSGAFVCCVSGFLNKINAHFSGNE